MNFGDRILGWIPWLLVTTIIAGIVHLVSILSMPLLATEDSYARISRVTAPDTLTILANKPTAMKMLPFEDPATAIGVCRFNLARGPLRLRGKLAGDGLTLMSFRNRFGTAFYSMNDRGTSRGSLDVVVVTAGQLEALEANDPEDELPSELRLVSPTNEGIVLLRTFAPEKGFYPKAVERLNEIACSLEAQPVAGASTQGS